jgi:hypothetical protein
MPPNFKTNNINIDDTRIHERIRVNEQLRIQTRYNEIDIASIGKFRNITNDDNYSRRQVEKLSDSIEVRTQILQDLRERLDKIETGELDEEMINHILKNTKEFKIKAREHMTKIQEKNKIKQEDYDFGMKMHQKDINCDKQDKSYFYNSTMKHFEKANESLPDYIQRDLKNMPNNEGYIWKSVYFYGLKNASNTGLTKMTDNRKGYKIIHVWSKNQYKVYEKKSREAEVLISTSARRQKN